MNFFKTDVPSSLFDGMASATDAMAKADRAVEAIKVNQAALIEAKKALADAERDLAGLEADVAIEGAKPSGDAAKKIAAALKRTSDATFEVGRLERLADALRTKAIEIDSELCGERLALESEVSAFHTVVKDQLQANLIDAIQPLVSWMKQAAAINAALHIRDVGLACAGVVVPHVESYMPPVVGLGRVALDRDIHLPLQEAWANDPEACALMDALKAPREVLAKLKGQQPVEQRLTTKQPYQLKGDTRGAGRISRLSGGDREPAPACHPQELNTFAADAVPEQL